MSADPQTFDPFRSPVLLERPAGMLAPHGRPGMLTTVCVIAMVLGALGMLNALMGTVGVVGGKQLQAAFQPAATPGMSPEFQDAHQKLQNDMLGVMQKHWWALLGSLALRFVVALLLLIGGIRALGLVASGRQVLLIGCAAALVFELLNAILQSFITIEYMTAMNTFANKMAEALPTQAAADGVAKILPYIMRGSMIAGLAIQIIISLVKIGFYIYSLIYLRKVAIRGLFRTTPVEGYQT